MYYVIKKQTGVPLKSFLGFLAPKYLVSKNSDNVIFEFKKDGKPIRKWVKKEEVILLTEDKELFIKTMDQFKETETIQTQLVEQARAQLDKSIENFTETMEAQIEEFSQSDAPSLLKNL